MVDDNDRQAQWDIVMRVKISLALLLLTAFPANASEPIKIGIGIPMSGPVASTGDKVHQGVAAAVEDINAKGGILGRPLEAVYEDDACDSKQGLTIASHFVADGVVLASHLCSAACMAARDVYRDNNILMMATGCSNGALTAEGYPLIQRAYYSAAELGNSVADYILQHKTIKRIAFIVDREGYTFDFSQHVRERLAEKNITPLDDETLSTGERDFTAAITKFKSDKADLIVLAAWPNELGLFVRQAREAGLKAAIISPDTGMIDVVAQIAGPAVDGLLFVYTPDYRNEPRAKNLVAEYKAKHIDPSGFTVFPYAMIEAYAQAVTQTGSTDPEKVAQTLRLNKFRTVIGDIGFDDKGNLIGVAPVVYSYEGTSYKPLTEK